MPAICDESTDALLGLGQGLGFGLEMHTCDESTDSLAAARSFLFCSPPLRILVRVRVGAAARVRVRVGVRVS